MRDSHFPLGTGSPLVYCDDRNLALSFAAGNATLWKPAPSTPLCSIAVTKIISEVLKRNDIPGAAAGLVIGGKAVGEHVVGSPDVDMVSFTGSEAVGREVGKVVQGRFGKVLLELGGNNGTRMHFSPAIGTSGS